MTENGAISGHTLAEFLEQHEVSRGLEILTLPKSQLVGRFQQVELESLIFKGAVPDELFFRLAGMAQGDDEDVPVGGKKRGDKPKEIRINTAEILKTMSGQMEQFGGMITALFRAAFVDVLSHFEGEGEDKKPVWVEVEDSVLAIFDDRYESDKMFIWNWCMSEVDSAAGFLPEQTTSPDPGPDGTEVRDASA